MAQIVWTTRALRDLRAIHDFIAQDSGDAAASVLISLISAVQRLADHPQSGRAVAVELGREIREVIRRPYRIPYRVRGNEVRILRVFHSARLIQPRDFEDLQ